MKTYNLFILSLLFSISLRAQTPKSIQASLNYVTVYSNGAELDHTAKVSVPAGSSEIVIGNLSNVVDENTIQVGSTNDVTIMSVVYRQEFHEKAPRTPETKNLEEEIEKAQIELKKTTGQFQTYSRTLTILDDNKDVAGANTGLSVTELQKLIDYYLVKSQDLRTQIQLLTDKQNKQTEEIARMQNRLNELSATKGNSKGEIVLQVLSNAATQVTLNISYISRNASWTPIYDVKTNSTKSPLKIIYKANVIQNTGLDWNDVKLSISSSNPSQSGTAPILNTWFLNYYQQAYGYGNKKYYNNVQSFKQASEKPMSIAGSRASGDIEAISGVNQFTTASETALNASFDIDLPYNIKSDGKAHSVSMKDYDIAAEYKYYAAPRIENDAFLMAEVSDWEKLNLVPGEANIIFDGAYIGKSFIDPNSTQDTLNLSLGRDKKIVVKREKLTDYCSTKLIGGKRLHTVTYEIKVKNTRKEAIEMMLKDQYPISQDKEIEIELLQSDDAMVNKETGIVTWKLPIAAGETKKVRISYSVKYPKDKQIGNL